MLDLRLISAEVLKLRHRRGMLVLAALLTLGVALLMFAVADIQHTGDPRASGPPAAWSGTTTPPLYSR